jgi:hypothetical protein
MNLIPPYDISCPSEHLILNSFFCTSSVQPCCEHGTGLSDAQDKKT